ncbi:MAG TPA: AIPR family protein [Chloroflexota bacterium]|nr:AIPR family protein [Chloroflexota bacterium]HUM67545.1 AIPR family protein [Chloroflexota bacterium]
MEAVLENYINDFCNTFNFKQEDNSVQFEHFCNYVIIPKLEETKEAIESVNVGNKSNPGIDGISITVNDHVVTTKEQVDYFLSALGRLEVEFHFIQAKTTNSFSMPEITSFISCIKDFFNSETSYNFNDETMRLHELKEYVYSKSLKMQDNPTLTIVYASAGQWTNDKNLTAAINISVAELRTAGYFKEVHFKPYDRDLLKKSYRELRNSISRSIKFEKHTILPQISDVDEAFIGMLPANEFLKLICNDHDEMLRNIFYDNVRDFQGFNTVNTEIKDTIASDEDKNKFSLLNNGITIVAKNIKKVGTTFTISDYQIVNGCQTSHVIYHNRKYIDDTVFIPVKIIVTQNYELMSKIIRANNRQTIVGSEAFEILAPFHKYLEEFYASQSEKHRISLYYERRSKQYEPNNLLRSNYITLSNQIKAFVAMYLDEPINASQRYFGELLELYKSKLFLENHLGYPYFVSGLTLNLVESYFNKGLIAKSYKRFKYHILMLVRIILTQYDVPEFNSRQMEQQGKELISKLLDEQVFTNAVTDAINIIEKNLSTDDYGYRNAHANIKFVESLIPKSSTQKSTGTIKYYNFDRGFGYIDIKQPQDIFFHIYDYHNMNSGEPTVGEQLRFDIVETEKGLRAINIQSAK